MMPTDIALEGLRLRWMARPADALAAAREWLAAVAGAEAAATLHRDPRGRPRLLRCDPALGDAGDWRLLALAPEPGFIAVLAHAP
jgi:hypothetical protein